KKEVKDAKLHIVGQHQPESLTKRASRDIIISNLAEDDTRSIVNANYEASVSASPLRGPGGTRLKVLAAMASKLPIVSTEVGVTGLGVKSGQEVIIEDDPLAMARSIIDLLKNPQKAEALAQNAYNFVKETYDYEKIAEKLSRIYLSLALPAGRQAKNT
ncbi:MAG: glycosyltransferase family 4 protein, partial [Microgenomates group bacterium]